MPSDLAFLHPYPSISLNQRLPANLQRLKQLAIDQYLINDVLREHRVRLKVLLLLHLSPLLVAQQPFLQRYLLQLRLRQLLIRMVLGRRRGASVIVQAFLERALDRASQRLLLFLEAWRVVALGVRLAGRRGAATADPPSLLGECLLLLLLLDRELLLQLLDDVVLALLRLLQGLVLHFLGLPVVGDVLVIELLGVDDLLDLLDDEEATEHAAGVHVRQGLLLDQLRVLVLPELLEVQQVVALYAVGVEVVVIPQEGEEGEALHDV